MGGGASGPQMSLLRLLRVEFLDLRAYRVERAQLVQSGTQFIRIRSVRRIHRFLEPIRKVRGEAGLLRPLCADDKTRDVICLLVTQHRVRVGRAERHIVFDEGRSGQQTCHARTIVIGVGSPERWELITGAVRGTLS
jgi:hypothetical protein